MKSSTTVQVPELVAKLGEGPDWLAERRQAAFERFRALGFPTTRDEAWRYTNVSPIARTQFRSAEPDWARAVSLLERAWVGESAVRLVLVDGRYVESLSRMPQQSGVRAMSLQRAIEQNPELVRAELARLAVFDNHAFTAWNTACFADGAVVIVEPGRVLDGAVHILHLSTGGSEPVVSHPRVLVLAGRQSQFAVVEEYLGPDGQVYLANAVTEIVCADGAVVEHYKLEREAQQAYHVAAIWARLGRDSQFTSHLVGLGSALSRHDVVVILAGPGSEAVLNGLYLVDGQRHADYQTLLHHVAPHCQSREDYKGILAGAGTGVFNGKIRVEPAAQKTDAIQHNKNLLLSREATINTKPQLEIYADDVRCTHGATVGQLEEEQLFYLQSRGMSAEEAKAALVVAFAGEVVERFRLAPLRAAVKGYIGEVARTL